MASILIVYSTTDGHTLRICERIKEVIEHMGHEAVLVSVVDDPDMDIRHFDSIVIGASIRYGRHRSEIIEFIKRNEQKLDEKPNAFFSVNVVARKPEKSSPETNPYLQKFLRRISWKPKNLAVFAGKINYPIYTFWDRQIIRLIMWMTRGPTDPKSVVEFTDWNAVDDFGRHVAGM
jgi:menaquinone-dependent protoporphyrinogen oxidase